MSDNYLNSGGVSGSLEVLSRPSTRPAAAVTKEGLYLNSYGREFGNQMTYSVGCSYAAGLGLGGVWGLLEGARRGGETSKLLVNSLVNGSATRGPFLANQFAIMTMFYVANNNIISWLHPGESAADSAVNAASAGALSGALFKSASGNLPLAGRYAVVGAGVFAAIDYVLKHSRLL
jgi:import inner membrane translocase subunit TIM23